MINTFPSHDRVWRTTEVNELALDLTSKLISDPFSNFVKSVFSDAVAKTQFKLPPLDSTDKRVYQGLEACRHTIESNPSYFGYSPSFYLVRSLSSEVKHSEGYAFSHTWEWVDREIPAIATLNYKNINEVVYGDLYLQNDQVESEDGYIKFDVPVTVERQHVLSRPHQSAIDVIKLSADGIDFPKLVWYFSEEGTDVLLRHINPHILPPRFVVPRPSDIAILSSIADIQNYVFKIRTERSAVKILTFEDFPIKTDITGRS